jgi:hypothetical protein
MHRRLPGGWMFSTLVPANSTANKGRIASRLGENVKLLLKLTELNGLCNRFRPQPNVLKAGAAYTQPSHSDSYAMA